MIVRRKFETLAERLLAYETATTASKTAPKGGAAVFRVCEKFRQVLGIFLGNSGFRELLSRALALSAEEASQLSAVHVDPDGTLQGVSGGEGEVVLVANLLTLLVTFIGEALTLRMLQEAWPKMNFDDLSLDTR